MSPTPTSHEQTAVSPVADERELAALACALGAAGVRGVSRAETDLAAGIGVPEGLVNAARAQILAGDDPLGAAYCRLRSPVARRPQGAVYTPPAIVRSMLAWAESMGHPDRIVDPGSGSGRFIVAAGRRFDDTHLVAIELDPLAALLTRANLAVHGLARRAHVITADYSRLTSIAGFAGKTLYIGNPPYVRHHHIAPAAKQWLSETAAHYGLKASQLAGLHVHFFLATVGYARRGDFGALITAAEWLDVNYGELVRNLFLGPLGGSALHIIEPTAQPFPDANTTGAITCFNVGSRPKSIQVRRVAKLHHLGRLATGHKIKRAQLAAASRWTPILDGQPGMSRDYVELGELCRVHRGQVTGANKFWIAGPHARDLPASVLYRTVTRAKEIYDAGRCLKDKSHLRQVIDLPGDLEGFSRREREAIDRFLQQGRDAGIDKGYIARHRNPWWSVKLREPAPILATYMARRPPGFVRNVSNARHINIAHGIYPRDPMDSEALDNLVEYLASQVCMSQGRTYAGGLTKFEPGEMQRLPVPRPEVLRAT